MATATRGARRLLAARAWASDWTPSVQGLNRLLLALLVTALVAIPGVIYHHHGIIHPYNSVTLAAVEASQAEGHLANVDFGAFSYDPEVHGHYGYKTILVTLLEVAALSPTAGAVLPIGSLLVPLAYFCVGRSLFRSNAIGAGFALFVAWDPSLAPGHYSVFAYAWERPLFLMFILLTVRFVREGRTAFIASLWIVFIGAFSIYWTSPFLMILFLAGVAAAAFVGRALAGPGARSLTFTSAVAFFVIYLFFSRVLYNNYLPAVASGRFGTVFDALLDLEEWILFRRGQEALPYQTATAANPVMNAILMLRYIVLLAPVAAYVAFVAVRYFRGRPPHPDRWSLVFWPLLFAALAQAIIYAARGHLSFRYLYFLSLPLAMIALERMRLPGLRFAQLAALVLLLAAATTIEVSGGLASHNTDADDVAAAADFLFAHADPEDRALMDFKTFAGFLVQSVPSGGDLVVAHYTSSAYAFVVGDDPRAVVRNASFTPPAYVVLNVNTWDGPTIAPGWRKYEPLERHASEIDANVVLSRFYDDGRYVELAARRA